MGGLLFTVSSFVPFLGDAVSFAASSALIASIRGQFRQGRAAKGERARLRADIAEGLRWLLAHRLLLAVSTTILLNAACYLAFGLGSNPWTAAVAWAIAGAATGVSNVVGTSLRQMIVPDHLIGRVVSAYRMLAYCAVPVGTLLGGVLGRTLGLRAPFLLAAAVRVAVGLLVLPVLSNRAVQAARLAEEAAHPPGGT